MTTITVTTLMRRTMALMNIATLIIALMSMRTIIITTISMITVMAMVLIMADKDPPGSQQTMSVVWISDPSLWPEWISDMNFEHFGYLGPGYSITGMSHRVANIWAGWAQMSPDCGSEPQVAWEIHCKTGQTKTPWLTCEPDPNTHRARSWQWSRLCHHRA